MDSHRLLGIAVQLPTETNPFYIVFETLYHRLPEITRFSKLSFKACKYYERLILKSVLLALLYNKHPENSFFYIRSKKI